MQGETLSDLIEGAAYYCADYVDTDVISPGRFEPYDGKAHLASVALIDYQGKVPFVDPETKTSPYTVIFAGEEFGCGSSRETAPQALSYAGARVVIARSFARIFFRNCVNMGLLYPIRCKHPFTEDVIGKHVEVDIGNLCFRVGDQEFRFEGFGDLAEIISMGGLLDHTKARLARGDL